MSPNYIVPTQEQLAAEFSFITGSLFEQTNAVCHVDSGKPGPVLGITINTHGNEPSGMAALWYLRNHFDIQTKLRKGSIFFVLNNLRATGRYFTALKMTEPGKKEEAMGKTRFADINMNRLPEHCLGFNLKEDSRYEVYRAQALRKVWQLFDVGFDIHSTSQKSPPMIVACGGLQQDLIRGFPISDIITNIENVQVNKPAVHFYGENGLVKTLAIEAGSHEDPTSYQCAITSSIALLKNLGMIDGKVESEPRTYDEYFVDSSVMFPNSSFAFVKEFLTFGDIKRDEIIARGNGPDIIALSDGHTLFAPKDGKVLSIEEEAMFLSRPVRKFTL